jgi:hypothetical protein
MDSNEVNPIDLAERILRENDCRIQSFLASGTTQYAAKKGKLSISPSFLSIRELCDWVVSHSDQLR